MKPVWSAFFISDEWWIWIASVKSLTFFSDRGTVGPWPEGEILHWQENHKKQEEAGKGHESPHGITVITAEVWLTLLDSCLNKLRLLFYLLSQKHKKKRKAEVFNFSAIHLIHDPQGKAYLTSPERLQHKEPHSSVSSDRTVKFIFIYLKISQRNSWSSWKTLKSALRWRSCWWSSFPDWLESMR